MVYLPTYLVSIIPFEYLLAAFDLFVIGAVYFYVSFMTRKQKGNGWIAKVLGRLKKYHLHTITLLIFAYFALSGIVFQLGNLIASNHITYLQKIVMINLSFIVIGVLFILIFFDKIRLFREE
ncbi:hypothetical protein NSQ89_14665 [Niallia sp. FSL R7-0648]|uniref:hypothetical protein n=1 Tax=Niallia sp. FSL R7-0648 TaxID=2954521 RepID=UPI0030F5474E